MPRVTHAVALVGLLLALLPLIVAFIYRQQVLRYQDVLIGPVVLEDYIDRSIPSLFSMADIHGDYPRAFASLVHAGVVDEHGDWTAGNSTFV